MGDFGAKLRQARERRGISLRQIAATTKISVSALESLERNDVSKLPGGIFSRSFVRSYAIEVGLDPDETVNEFVESFHDVAPVPEVRARAIQDEGEFENRRRIARVVLTLLVISLPIAGVILYFSVRAHSNSQQTPSQPPAAASSAPAPPSVPPKSDVPRVDVARADAARSDAPTIAPPIAPPSALSAAVERASPASTAASAGPAATEPAAPLTLDLHPTARCWVSVTADGHRVLAKVMDAGERVTLTAEREAVIQVGDAGAFAYSVNGKEGRPLGKNGEVKTVRLTPDSAASYLR